MNCEVYTNVGKSVVLYLPTAFPIPPQRLLHPSLLPRHLHLDLLL